MEFSRDPLPLMQRYAYVGGNPVNLVDPTGLWPCRGCILPKPSISAISEWTEVHVIDPLQNAPGAVRDSLVEAARDAGYVDWNLATVCYYVCASFGVQMSLSDGFHPYAGSGAGFMASTGLSWAPGQTITEGVNCGGQVSYGFASGQVGAGGVKIDKEGSPNFTRYGEVGVGFGFGAASTCVYVW